MNQLFYLMALSELLQALFAVGLGIVAAQTPAPDQVRQIDVRSAEAQRIIRQSAARFIGYPTLRPLRPIRILGPLKKMENK